MFLLPDQPRGAVAYDDFDSAVIFFEECKRCANSRVAGTAMRPTEDTRFATQLPATMVPRSVFCCRARPENPAGREASVLGN
jgi:hypothetical protein